MNELPFLSEYTGQTISEILALRGKFRDDSLVLAIESALIERHNWHALDDAQTREAILQLTDAERAVLAIEAMEREVNNGGYFQFFINSSKHFAPFLVDALNAIGCSKLAEVSSQAIDTLRLPPNFDGMDCDEACMAAMDDVQPKLNELDEHYFECPEPIVERLLSYVERSAHEIRIPR